MKNQLYCYLILMMVTVHGHSQVEDFCEYKLQHHSVEQGLSQGSVYSIIRDNVGYIWMTSYEGLNKYDGQKFESYKHNPLDSTTIGGNNTIGLAVDSKNNIWTGSENCLNKLNRDESKFERIFVRDENGKNINSEHYVIFADSTYVYYINDHDGLCKYNIEKKSQEIIDESLKYQRSNFVVNAASTFDGKHIYVRMSKGIRVISLSDNTSREYFTDNNPTTANIQCLDFDNKGVAYLVSGKKIYSLDIVTEEIDAFKIPNSIEIEVLDINVIDHNQFWICTGNDGMVLIDTSQNILCQIDRNQKKSMKLKTSTVSNLYRDSENILWASADPHGVYSITENKQPINLIGKFELNNKTIDPGGVRNFLELDSGEILVATEDEALFIFDPSLEKITQRILTVYPDNHATIMKLDREGNVWIGSYRGLFKANLLTNKVQRILNTENPSFPQESNLIWGIIEDRYGHIYFSTDAGIYTICPESSVIQELGVFQNKVSGQLYIDNDDYLYLPWHHNGFATIHVDSLWHAPCVMNDSANYFHHFNDTLNVKCFHISKDQEILWVASINGLYKLKYNKSRSAISILDYIGIDQKFPSNYLYSIIEDQNENLWLSSNKGIIRYNPVTDESYFFSEADGLQGNEYNTNAFLYSSDSTCYFGGVNGFNYFKPSAISINVQIPESPLIKSITIGNRIYHIDKTEYEGLILQHDENDIEIKFTTPYFQSSNLVNYEFKINDGHWVNVANSKSTFLTNLEPDKYIISFRSYVDNDAYCQKVSKLSFEIKPAWWNTWIFRSLVAILLFLIIYFFLYTRIRSIQKVSAIQSRLGMLKMKALQSQMNPHFIFNCLNAIDGYIATNNRAEASSFLNKFAKLIRRALTHSRQDLISLSDELDLVDEYIYLEQTRFNPPFHYQKDLNHTSIYHRVKIPPYLIQPYIENAIWHGLSNSKTDAALLIQDQYTDGIFSLIITDNGPGIDATLNNVSQHKIKSLGIEITQERIELINNKYNLGLSIVSKDRSLLPGHQSGTQVTISVVYGSEA